MIRIKNLKHLDRLLKKFTQLKQDQIEIGERIGRIQAGVLAYYKRKGRTSFEDSSGVTWRQQQGTSTRYDDKAFKQLLKKKGINTSDVYKKVMQEVRDEAAIMKLLKEKRITVAEWKTVAKLTKSSAYLRKYGPNRGRSNDTNKDS